MFLFFFDFYYRFVCQKLEDIGSGTHDKSQGSTFLGADVRDLFRFTTKVGMVVSLNAFPSPYLSLLA